MSLFLSFRKGQLSQSFLCCSEVLKFPGFFFSSSFYPFLITPRHTTALPLISERGPPPGNGTRPLVENGQRAACHGSSISGLVSFQFPHLRKHGHRCAMCWYILICLDLSYSTPTTSSTTIISSPRVRFSVTQHAHRFSQYIVK